MLSSSSSITCLPVWLTYVIFVSACVHRLLTLMLYVYRERQLYIECNYLLLTCMKEVPNFTEERDKFPGDSLKSPQKMNLHENTVFTCMYVVYHVHSYTHCLFQMLVDTLLLCFCEDVKVNDGSEEKPYFMSKNLMVSKSNVVMMWCRHKHLSPSLALIVGWVLGVISDRLISTSVCIVCRVRYFTMDIIGIRENHSKWIWRSPSHDKTCYLSSLMAISNYCQYFRMLYLYLRWPHTFMLFAADYTRFFWCYLNLKYWARFLSYHKIVSHGYQP